jgi:hypothetical protein
MSVIATNKNSKTIAIAKNDLVNAWSTLEKLVVSLHRIGSHFATEAGKRQTAEERTEMLREIDRFLSPSVMRELGQARVSLSDYLPEHEAQRISDRLEYWQPRNKGRASNGRSVA